MEYEYDDCDSFEYGKWQKVRERNLKINIAKQLIINGFSEKKMFTRQELKDVFSFKESDVLYVAPELFEISEDKYTMTPEFTLFVEKVVRSNKAVKEYLTDAEAEFIKIYGSFYAEAERDTYRAYAGGKYQETFNRLKEIIPIIHWGRLPIFNKYLLYNREKDPELEMIEYYEHPDCLNDLLNEVKGKGLILSNKSDDTLDKEMPFKVYTRRWGHEDRYSIKRTVNGWHCGHIAISGECKKSGEGGLFNNLDHDYVFYPKDGVAYAMEKLWDAADEGEIDFDELTKRIQQIADWISAVEKSIATQPEWVGYY